MNDFIESLGVEDESTTSNDVDNADTQNDSSESLSLDSEVSTQSDDSQTKEVNTDTEQNTSKMDEFAKQIEMLEKRISDKDAYINELRNKSEAKSKEESVEKEEEGDFWDNPEGVIKDLTDKLAQQDFKLRETTYAVTVDDYWQTVNPEAVNVAMASDSEFANSLNTSAEPYKVAYEYLKGKKQSKETANKKYEDELEAKFREKYGIKTGNKETVPSMSNMGSSNKQGSDESEDGFSAVFGSGY